MPPMQVGKQAALGVLCVAVIGAPVQALDKQGASHAGGVSSSSTFNLSGSALLGVSIFNPSYAARPDNTGLALLRYAGHLDVDLFGPRLSIPLDVNIFTDRERPGFEVLAPTEFDIITGLTSTWQAGPGALEVGARFEYDMPVDRPGFTQAYVDARARYRLEASTLAPRIRDALWGGDVAGWVTLGGFLFNPTYAARPDNTGLALLRYAAHAEVSVLDDLFSLAFDLTFFTDRQASWVVPSELDFTIDLIVHRAPLELHLAYERDMPLDRPGLVQHFAFLAAAVSFDLAGATRASTDRNELHSP
jgi:hypothetical protein